MKHIEPATGKGSVLADSGKSAQRVTVLSVGYLVLDIVTTSSVIGRSAGGTAGNVAANLAWLGTRSGMLARIGRDTAGEFLRQDLSAAGVDVTHIHRSEAVETPILIQELMPSGHRFLFKCPQCHHKFASHRPATVEQAQEAASSAPSILFVDRASSASIELMVQVKKNGGTVMFEPNGPGRPKLTKKAIGLADILKVSDDRASSLGELIEDTPQAQIKIRTYGPEGLAFQIGNGAWHQRRPQPATVTDSAGAGDWVTAGLLMRLAEDPTLTYRNINKGLKLGQSLAALSCAFVGARGMNRALSRKDAADLLGFNFKPLKKFGAATKRTPSFASTGGCPACGSQDHVR